MSNYYKVEFKIKPYSEDAADLLAAFLADAGFESFVSVEEGLEAYVPESLYDSNVIREVVEDFPIDCNIEWISDLVKQINWNEEWEKNYFQPLNLAGGQCVVHSSFHTEFSPAPYEIVIDPKMAFGTGHHATTSMMVNHLFNIDMQGKSVIDMGTGTGILSILAKKLGASKVTGIEIDPGAYENARENCAINNVDIELICGDASALAGVDECDVFIANINRNIILADLSSYVRLLRQDAVLLLSGFYKEDIPLLEAALKRNGMKITETVTEEGGWSSIKANFE